MIQVDVLTLAVLNRLSSRMVFGITAYDADGDDPTESPEPDQESDVRFEGADDIESNQRGKTLNAADGRLSGDLTLAVGTRGGNASFSDVMAGTATVLDMNPFRDVAAQFDILIRNKVVNPYGFDALILRLRAAYLGAFSAINSDATSDDASASEFSVSLGVAW